MYDEETVALILDLNTVELTREQLLNCNSETYNALVNNIRDVRTLTEEEDGTVKKTLRMIRNRESAREHRLKIKGEYGNLRDRITQLEHLNAFLEDDNSKLRATVYSLENILSMKNNTVKREEDSSHLTPMFDIEYGELNVTPPLTVIDCDNTSEVNRYFQ